MGDHHARSLGAEARAAWPDLQDLSDQILGGGLAGRALSLRSHEITVDRSGGPERAWFDVDCSPIRDDRGETIAVWVVSVETTQRVLAERKVAGDLARQREMFEQAPGFICLLSGPELMVEFTNAAHRRLFGVHDAEGRPYMEAYAEIAALGAPEVLFQVYETGERYIGRADPVLVPQPGGGVEEHLLDLMLVPVKDDEGKVQALFLEGFDVTEQVHAQRAAEESNRRLTAALAIARLGAFSFEWDPGPQAERVTLDARAREIFGFGPEEKITRADLIARIDPDDFQHVDAESLAANAAERTRREYEFRIHLPDGSVRHIASVSDFSLGRDGRRRRFLGVFDDVTERRAAERRQRLLLNELNHRVKNTLATVQSIAARTLRSATDLTSARHEFESRLVALAAAHDLLTAQAWRGALLADVATTAMTPFEATHRPQISRSGPRV
jgi:PAS domain S-box-containing protein